MIVRILSRFVEVLSSVAVSDGFLEWDEFSGRQSPARGGVAQTG